MGRVPAKYGFGNHLNRYRVFLTHSEKKHCAAPQTKPDFRPACSESPVSAVPVYALRHAAPGTNVLEGLTVVIRTTSKGRLLLKRGAASPQVRFEPRLKDVANFSNGSFAPASRTFGGDMAAPRTRHSDFDWAWGKTAFRRCYWRCPIMPRKNGSRSVLVIAPIVIGPIIMPINVVK